MYFQKLLSRAFYTVLALFFCGNISAQGGAFCGATPFDPGNRPAQPTNSVQLIKDLIPESNDRVAEVNVRVWVFLPQYASSLTSIWTHSSRPTTSLDVKDVLDEVNMTFSNVTTNPKLTVPGYTYNVNDAKIQFKLKGLDFVASNAGYMDVSGYAEGVHGRTYFDPYALNIYLGATIYTTVSTTTPTYVAQSYGGGNIALTGNPINSQIPNTIYVHPEFYSTPVVNSVPGGTVTFIAANIRDYGKELRHEIGHYLGLNHSTETVGSCFKEPPTFILPTFGCSNYVEAKDIVMETYSCVLNQNNQWVKLYPPCPCQASCGTSNIMSQDGSSCCNSFTPHQMAVMHFNLRTYLKTSLSVSGATAALTANTFLNYNVVANETWQDGDRYFKGNIIVKANKTLIVKCGVAMTSGASILVEPGAQLIVDGGHITNISGRLWGGVRVLGNPNQSQTATNPNNPGALLYQGIVRLKNGAKISNASVGVRNYHTTWTQAGGVLFAQNSTFLNNRWDVQIESASNQAPKTNISWIYNCNFETNNFLNDPANPFPIDHIYLYRTKGVAVRGCTFECIPSHISPGNGIRSIDAVYTVDQQGANPCVFKNLDRGVYVHNVNYLTVPLVANSRFENNEKYAGYFLNANYLNLTSNTVVVSQTASAEGFYLNNCRFYTIKGNSFSKSGWALNSSGLLLYKAGAGSHQVYKNSFSGLAVGINCMDDNSGQNNILDGLKMNCNVFNAGIYNAYDIALNYTPGLVPPTVMRMQGQNSPPLQAPTNLVRNIYGAQCGNQNKWYIHSQSTKSILHGANINSVTAVTQPTPQSTAPQCSRPLLSVVGSTIILDYANHCPFYPVTSGGSGSSPQAQRLSLLNHYIDSLKGTGVTEDHYDIGAAINAKMGIFLSDSIADHHGLDSVVATIQANSDYMHDVQEQLFFAHLLRGDLVAAGEKLTAIQNINAELGGILAKVFELESDTLGLAAICGDHDRKNFLEEYASNTSRDGHQFARAILLAACDTSFGEPHAYPEEEEDQERPAKAEENPVGLEDSYNSASPTLIIYPNPASDEIQLQVKRSSDQKMEYSIESLLGQILLKGSVSTNKNLSINVHELSNGVYFLNVRAIEGENKFSRKILISK